MSEDAAQLDALRQQVFSGQLSPEAAVAAVEAAGCKPKPVVLKLLLAILRPKDGLKAKAIFKSEHAFWVFNQHGYACAAGMSDILGLGEEDQMVSTCITRAELVPTLVKRIAKDCKLRDGDNGVVLVVPLSGATAALLRSNGSHEIKEIQKMTNSEVREMRLTAEYELIMAVVNPGYSEEVMDTAREVGAITGTVMHARQLDGEEESIWGIHIQGEREILLLIVADEDKAAVLHKIAEKHGFRSPAQGLVVSLPIETMVGVDDD